MIGCAFTSCSLSFRVACEILRRLEPRLPSIARWSALSPRVVSADSPPTQVSWQAATMMGAHMCVRGQTSARVASRQARGAGERQAAVDARDRSFQPTVCVTACCHFSCRHVVRRLRCCTPRGSVCARCALFHHATGGDGLRMVRATQQVGRWDGRMMGPHQIACMATTVGATTIRTDGQARQQPSDASTCD
jgi:hypothetical protein